MKFWKLALLGCLAPAALLASDVAPCAEQNLEQYLGAPNCSIGNLVFGSFSYTPISRGSGVAVPAIDIMVTPILTPGDYGLQFSSNWVDKDVGGIDIAIGYFVATGNLQADLDAASLNMVGTVRGASNAILNEYVCPGEAFSRTCANQVHLHESMGPTGPFGRGPQVPYATFDPVATMQLVEDLRVYDARGTSTGTAISSQYPTPEPVTPLLCFSGLLLVWGLLKRRSA